MFVLKARNGSLFYLLNSQEFTVGRKDCQLLITNDQSISRLHAKIVFKNKKPMLVDIGSRYGTFVNKEKLTTSTEMELKEGDEIRFGQLQGYYMVEQITIITTTSTIKGDQKKNLINNINVLGGTLQSNWTSHCTHVTVDEILLTVKVLCAVIKGIPIVTLKYWDDYVANVKENLPPPDIKNYEPTCSEVTLGKNVSFDFKPERLNLFKNKIFVFPTKTDKAKMLDLIDLSGGASISWDVSPFTNKDLIDSNSEYIILEMGTSPLEDIDPTLAAIIKYNIELGKRTVPIQEIALAVINCSCEKNCNPGFDRKGTVLASKTQRLETQHVENVLVTSTQTQNFNSDNEFKSQEVIQLTNEVQIISEDSKIIKVEEASISTKNIMEVDSATSVKRENASCENSLNAPKRIKFESLVTTDVTGKQSEPTGNVAEPTGKPKFTFKNDSCANIEQAKHENVNPFAMKRKNRETDVVDKPAKRSTAWASGDSPSSKSLKLVNPFSLMMAKRSASISKDATVSSISTSEQNNLSDTYANGNVSKVIDLDMSAIVPVDSSTERNCNWISKTNDEESKSSICKSIVPDPSFISEQDDAFTKYIESFRNLMVVEEESMVIRKSVSTSNISHNLSTFNGQNFKKFKKVQPLKIQTTIIPESSYIQIVCNDHGAVPTVHDDSDDGNDVRNPFRARFAF